MHETIGQQLQRARQSRGLNLEEAAQATCIRPRYLQALEADDHSNIPSKVQGKGFLRNYAAFLGLSVQPLLDLWEGKAPIESAAPVEVSLENRPSPEADSATEPLSELENEEPSPQVFVQDAAPAPSATAAPSASQAIFNEIGHTLRKQRELLSLSMTEVERYTHLRIHYLKALEAGKMDELPSMVQGRGMLNNYARFLSLDANQVMDRFADALQVRREELNVVQPAHRTPVKTAAHPALKRLLSMDLLVGGGMVVLLVVFVIWGASQVMALGSQGQPTQTAPSVSEALISTPQVTEEGLTPETIETIETAEVSQPIATDPGLGETTPEVTQMGTEPAGPPAPASGKIMVYVVSRLRAWMRVTVDGRVQFNGRTVAGSAYPFEGNDTIELVTGNAAALQVYYNQDELGTLGNWSEVVHLVFAKDQGVQTPTPTASPTPTQTPRVSPTPTPTATTRPGLPYQPTVP